MGIIIVCFLRAVVRIIPPKGLRTEPCLGRSINSINSCQARGALVSHLCCPLRPLAAICCLFPESSSALNPGPLGCEFWSPFFPEAESPGRERMCVFQFLSGFDWALPVVTADGDCSHGIKRLLLLGRKAMTSLDSILKSRDITLPTKVRLVNAMVFPAVMYGCESWTVKKAEHRRIDAFELWCGRRLLRVLWTARTSQS